MLLYIVATIKWSLFTSWDSDVVYDWAICELLSQKVAGLYHISVEHFPSRSFGDLYM